MNPRLLPSGNRIKGKEDTMIDLVIDSAGALLAGVVAVARLKRELDREGVRLPPTVAPVRDDRPEA